MSCYLMKGGNDPIKSLSVSCPGRAAVSEIRSLFHSVSSGGVERSHDKYFAVCAARKCGLLPCLSFQLMRNIRVIPQRASSTRIMNKCPGVNMFHDGRLRAEKAGLPVLCGTALRWRRDGAKRIRFL
ncbi:hypothetical protein KCP70_02570 [Salmonella enterica subsp. enterica]|nr:hypothetical protein KCP70_02570 [Salmonella enterica subsp. enterica]